MLNNLNQNKSDHEKVSIYFSLKVYDKHTNYFTACSQGFISASKSCFYFISLL